MILRLWLLVVLTLAGAFAPSRASARTVENRTWDFFLATTETRPETAPQVADSHQGNLAFGYELASGCSQAAESRPLWSATKSLTAEENAAAHAAKHGAEFPELAAGEYVPSAQKFVTEPPAGSLTKVRPNGDTLIYDPATNTFGVRTADGAPRTMFRPSDGAKYWEKQ